MKSAEHLFNALSKIHSLVLQMAQERRITLEELNDYNDAQQRAGAAFDDLQFELRKAWEERKAANESRIKSEHEKSVYFNMLRMIGLTKFGIETMAGFGNRFIASMALRMEKSKAGFMTETDFDWIHTEYLWLQACIDRDKRNISAVKVQKQIYTRAAGKTKAEQMVRQLSRQILEQVATESAHIAEGIKAGKSTEELLPEIENHWHKQLRNRKVN